MPVAVNCFVPPTSIVALEGITVMDSSVDGTPKPRLYSSAVLSDETALLPPQTSTLPFGSNRAAAWKNRPLFIGTVAPNFLVTGS